MSHELRIGSYREVVHTEEPFFQIISRGSFLFDPTRKVPTTIESFPVTCLADIPIMHLDYHAKRYGNIAIGFHRESAIRHGFSPVFYQLVGAKTLETIQSIFTEANFLEGVFKARTDELKKYMASYQDYIGHTRDASGNMVPAKDPGASCIQSLRSNVQEFLAYVKSFRPEEIDTIYCEREWRSVNPFHFAYEDISMVVVPRNSGNGDHYDRLVAEADSLGIPRSVSIVAWDDLVEH